MLKTLPPVCVLAVLAATSTSAPAQTADTRAVFAFSETVTLPGATLPAGTYLFRDADESTRRRAVQVSSADGERSHAVILAIPIQRTDVPASSELRMLATAEGMPIAIHSLWHRGSTVGWEFVYPKEQALVLARRANGSVLTTVSADNDTIDLMKHANLARVEASGSETAFRVEENPPATDVAGFAQHGEVASPGFQVLGR